MLNVQHVDPSAESYAMQRFSQPASVHRAQAELFDGPSFEWDHLLADFHDSTLEQTATYARGKWGKSAKCYLVRRDETVMGGGVVSEVSMPGTRVGLSYLKFGPFWRRRGCEGEAHRFETVVEALQQKICHEDGRCLVVMPRPEPAFNVWEADALKALGFTENERSFDPNRYLVDLHLDEDAQRSSLDQKWRYNLRRAVKAGVTVEREDSADGFAAFQSLHDDMRHRKGYDTGERIALVPELNETLHSSMRPMIFVARHDGRPVAGAVVCPQGDTASYVFGATASDALNLRAGYALQWKIVCDLSATREARWYDLGGEGGVSGLRQFKKGLVGRKGLVQRLPNEHVYGTSPLSEHFSKLLFFARSVRWSLRQIRA